MTAYKSIGDFNAGFKSFTSDLQGKGGQQITFDMAHEGQKIARQAAAADLGGDPKFSGWAPRLTTIVKPLRSGGHILTPTKESAGPWTVAQFGRHSHGGAGGFQGPGVNLKTGRTGRRKDGTLRAVRTRTTSTRWNGVTRGKSTATDAVAGMQANLDKLADAGIQKLIRKHFD